MPIASSFSCSSLASLLRRFAAFCTALLSVAAFAQSPNVVISQVYGGGGNAGALRTNDYVELFNRGTVAVSVTGWSVQYAATAGTTWQATSLSGSIPAGGYYLVQMASGGAVGAALPTPDATGVTNMSATAGKVALLNVATAITAGTACPTGATVVDIVGYGPGTTTCNETAPTTPNISATLAALRASNGCTDTNNNAGDFANATPNPRNSATALNSCSSLPNLTISSVTANEGNSGITAFTFTVSLSAPAGAGGVTFDIATANGTATAGSDYIARTLTAQTIPAGSSTYTFTVDVTGDTTPETNETFFVNVTNAVGANITAGQGTGTITNDDAAPNLTISDVSLAEGNSGTTTFSFTVSLSAPAPLGGVTFDIATANGTATAGSDYTATTLTAQTIPAGSSNYTFNVNVIGDTVSEPNETFFVNITNVTNAIPLDAQGLGTIINDDVTRIHDVQGSGAQSPIAGASVVVEGIVTADFQGPNQLKGFYIQEADADADANPLTSEGIFIFTNLVPYTVAVGDRVRVSGTVIEFGTAPNTLTEVTSPTISTLSSGNALPAVVDVSLPVAAIGDLERYEGMRVRFTQSLTVSDHFDLAHFGEVTLTANGRALQPTNEVDPNDAVASGTTSSGNSNAAAVTAFDNLNVRSSILLDDASTLSYPPAVPFINPADNTLRLGSTVANLTGILSQSFGTHRLYATVTPAFNYAPRPATPPAVGGNVKVASANVLNYFNGDGAGGGFPTARGADSALEFSRQRAKTIAALNGLGADVIGLLEMENDGTGPASAIQDLINGLNAAAGAGTWNFIADPANYASVPGGTDAIRPVFIYKTAVVAPVGLATTINDSAFVIARAPVAQTFRLLSNNEQFVAVINHFKAKGSSGAAGPDLDQGDGQAAFNNTRRLQANALVGFINTLAATTPRVISLGDYNAYEQEDPIDILRAGGLSTIINNSYSYMFNGLSGSLDHAVGNAALLATVSGSGKWHINADEPVFLDYNVETKNTAGCTSSCTSPDYFAATPFRASDHDPVLVGLNLIAAQTITFPVLTSFSWSGGSATLAATASSGLPVTYSLVSGPCVISGTTVTATGAGACVIAADQAGNTNYNAAPRVTQSVTVTAAAQTITFPAITSFSWSGGSATLAATASSGLPVTYSVVSGLCAISGTTVTATGAGACVIAADQAGNVNYSAAAQVTQPVTVTAAAQTITFPAIASFSWSGGSATLAATASSGLTVTYGIASGPCVVTGNTLTATGAGTCSVLANQAGNANYVAAATVTNSVTVLGAPQTIAFGALANRTFGDAPIVVSATGGASTAPVTFTSITPTVCTAGGTNGSTITIVGAGVCTVTANQAGDTNYTAAAAVSQSFTVAQAAQAITGFAPTSPVPYAAGGTFALTATGGASGLPVTFASTTPAICTTGGTNGATVTIVAAGACTLTANQAGNANYSAAPAVNATVTISAAAQTISFAPIGNRALGSAAFAVSATATSGLPVAFASTTPATCTMSGTTVTLVAAGVCTIRASQAGNANYAAAANVDQSFTIAAAPPSQLTIAATPAQIVEGQPYQLAFTVSGNNPTGTVTWSTVPATTLPAGCSPLALVNGRAVVPAQCLPTPRPGEPVTITATYSGDANNATSTVTISIAVTGILREITLAPSVANPRAGTPIALTALVRGVAPNGAVSFSITTPAGTSVITGCTDIAVVSVPQDINATVATCNTTAVAGAVQYTATYTGDSINTLAPVTIVTNSPANGPRDYNDIWWGGAAEAGWGLHITQKGLQQFVPFYVYDAAGKTSWYAMSGGTWNADFTRITAPIYQPSGSLFSAYDVTQWRAGAPVGTGTLTFTDANNATFDYTINGVNAKKNITRFTYSTQDLAPKITVKDIWWGGERENGWGLTIAQQDRTLFAAWYTYGPDGKPIWYTMQNGTFIGTTYVGQLFTATSSPWLGVPYNAQAFRSQLVGTMTLDFRDQNNATMTYTVNGVTQTKLITRFGF